MMDDLRNDRREGAPYLNPIYLMAHSGARGGIEQIRQLAGMRGLMAKPNGNIIETPIKANFKEGLSVAGILQLHARRPQGPRRHGAEDGRLGLLDTQLADVAQNVVITMPRLRHDPGRQQERRVQGRGRSNGPCPSRSVAESAATRITNPVTDEGIVNENDMITVEAARQIESMGIDKVLVRSPMTCQAPLGVCRLCYGMDLATGPSSRKAWRGHHRRAVDRRAGHAVDHAAFHIVARSSAWSRTTRSRPRRPARCVTSASTT